METIRYAARRAVAASALRPVAAEMGMAPSWLNAFVEGKEAVLRTQTRKKLLDWYVRVAPQLAEVDAGTAAGALDVLTGGLLEGSERSAAHARLVQALARSYADAGPLPDWVRALLDEDAAG